MSESAPGSRARPWRGLRGRLVAVCVGIAVVLGVLGSVLFFLTLRAGLVDYLDGTLDARADAVEAAVRAADPTAGQAAAVRDAGGGGVGRFSVLYRADGSVAVGAARTGALGDDLRRQAERSVVRTTETVDGEPYRVLLRSFQHDGETWYVRVGSSLDEISEPLTELRRGLLVGVPLAVAAVAVGAWFVAGAALRPVERMRRDAEEMSAGDRTGQLTVRLTEPATGDEIEALARTLNRLLDRLHESLARQRDLVADSGHELRTPLAVLRTELELADRPGRDEAELRDAIAHARVEVERLTALADDLLFLARTGSDSSPSTMVGVDVRGLVDVGVRACAALAAAQQVRFQVRGHGTALADPELLRRALDNLLLNAVDFSPPGGVVTVAVTAEPGAVLVRVQDQGPGFPLEFLPRAFERFSRADASRRHAAGTRSTGLGLAVVATAAEQLGGSVTARNRAPGGAEVTLRLRLG